MPAPVSTRGPASGRGGMALIAVMIFALIVSLVGLAFFSIASYETKGAFYRQRSSEAFYLADGGIARARGELLDDIAWRGPVTSTRLGSGTYDVTVADTVLGGQDGVAVRSVGQVGNAERGVEALGSVKTILEEFGMVALGNVDVSGNITVTGNIHAGGTADFGPGDTYLKSGNYDEGYPVVPPPIHTEPAAFGAGTTYYRVIGTNGPKGGRVYKYDWSLGSFQLLPSAKWLPPSMVRISGGNYTFTFKGPDMDTYFSTVFTRDPADHGLVVDFGQPDSTGLSVADVVFNKPNTLASVNATIINTRFEGVDEAQRTAPCSGAWKGGSTTFGSKVVFTPDNCVALIVQQLGPPQGMTPTAQASIGTSTSPALAYVTGSVNGLKGDLEVWGALIALCDIESQGGPTVHQLPGIENCIPFDFKTQGSGFFHLREWREVPL